MRLHDKLGRLLQAGTIEGEGGGRSPQPPPRRGWRRALVLVFGLVAAMVGDAALAAVADDMEEVHMLSDDDSILWQPPNSTEIIVDEAQWGSPVAPFVFDGGVLNAGASFGSEREFRIDKRAVINTHGGAVLHLSGKITSLDGSSQGLAKLGAGTLRLSGANDYRGNTLLLQGGLDVAHSRALGQGYNTLHVNTGTRLRYAPGISVGNGMQLQEIAIAPQVPAGSYAEIVPADHADSVQWIVDNGEAVQAGALSGSASIVKQGSGVLRFTGTAMAYTGLFTVNQGTLAVDGLFWGPVQINDGARLQGEGQVGATTVMAGGSLASGNNPGGLKVHGDLVFRPGSRFDARVAPSGVGGSVGVTGRALLNGDVMALAQAGDWQASTRYTLLRAEGGFDGTRFASVATNMPFLSPSLEYDAQQVYLTLQRNGTDFEDVADDSDDDVADVLDDPDDLPDIHDKVVELTGPQARQAFKQLSGDWTGSVRSSILDDTRFLREAVWARANPFASDTAYAMGRAAGQRLAGSSGGNAWAYSFYSTANRNSSQGVDGDARDVGGVVLGVGRSVGSGASAGVFFGAQHSGLRREASMADAGIDSIHAGISLAGRWRGALLTLGAAYTWHTIDSTRKISVGRLQDRLSGHYRARGAQLFGQASRPFVVPMNRRLGTGTGSYTLTSLTLEPFARVAGLRMHTRGFTEKGGSAALDVLRESQAVIFATLGLSLAQDIDTARGNATMDASLAWRYVGGDVRSLVRQRFRDSVGGAVFTSEGLRLSRGAWQFQLGLRARLAKKMRLGLAYAGQFASGMRDHGARLDLTLMF